jgi:hypothetical protein
MKQLTTIVLIVVIAITVSHAQKTPESFFNKTPAIPSNICSIKLDDIQSFSNKVTELRNEVRKEMDIRTEALSSDENKQKIASQYLGNTGISSSDMAKLQSGDLSEAEQAALGAKIVANMGMNKAKPKKGNASKEEALNPLLKTQASLSQLEKEAQKYYKGNITPLEKEPRAMYEGSMESQAKAGVEYRKKLLEAKRKYCEKFTPRKIEILNSFKSSVKQHMGDVRKYEGEQMAVLGSENQDIMLLGMIDSYLEQLRDVFSYKIDVTE